MSNLDPVTMEGMSFLVLCALHKHCRQANHRVPGADFYKVCGGSPDRVREWMRNNSTAETRTTAWNRLCELARAGHPFDTKSERAAAAVILGQSSGGASTVTTVNPNDAFGEFDQHDSNDQTNDSAPTMQTNPVTTAARVTYAPNTLEARVEEIATAVVGLALEGFTPNSVDAAAVQRIVDEALARVTMPTRIVMVNTDGTERDIGVQHARFPQLVRFLDAKLPSGFSPNVWLYGPPGTGKSHAARAYAEARGLQFYYTGPLGTKYDLTGFIDAGGNYRDTDWYKCWTKGGVFLFDEIRGSVPSALLAFAGALANGHCSFPGGLEPRHKDCILIVADNLPPGQTSADFNGGFKQDAMLGSRFVTLHWPIDEALEDTFAFGERGREWVRTVRRYRKAAATVGAKAANVTPRAVEQGCALLNVGVELSDVLEATIRGGLSDDAWSALKAAA